MYLHRCQSLPSYVRHHEEMKRIVPETHPVSIVHRGPIFQRHPFFAYCRPQRAGQGRHVAQSSQSGRPRALQVWLQGMSIALQSSRALYTSPFEFLMPTTAARQTGPVSYYVVADC